jgi:pimeloyl-ACP methyl ester carboxylesterase
MISAPVLLLSGDRDPFARIELLRAAVRQLPQADLVVYPGVGHGLAPVLGDALERVAGWIGRLATLDR